jgi:hypothetical protein
MTLSPGTRLGAYEVAELIGAGGMARYIAPATRQPPRRQEVGGIAKGWPLRIEKNKENRKP